jgi:hypothetical protein
MEREIEFRGLRSDGLGWVYGSFIHNNIDCPCIIDIDAEQYEVIPETVGQYTERNDAEIDGEKVYDGDIIQNCDTGDLQEVYWNVYKASWYCLYIENKDRIVSLVDSLGNLNKKIGNIHE